MIGTCSTLGGGRQYIQSFDWKVSWEDYYLGDIGIKQKIMLN
jgi:hypothetical protein